MKFTVAQTDRGVLNHLGEMTDTQLFAHVQVRLGLDINEANDFMSEVEKHASVRLFSQDGQIRLDVQRIIAGAATLCIARCCKHDSPRLPQGACNGISPRTRFH